MKTYRYGESLELRTPQGVTVAAQVVSVGRWNRPRVAIPSWQQECNIDELLADGWHVAETNTDQATGHAHRASPHAHQP